MYRVSQRGSCSSIRPAANALVSLAALSLATLLLLAGGEANGATLSANDAASFQAALNNAQPGDTILLPPGVTIVGDFELPVKSGAAYITIRSSAQSSALPGSGQRTGPAYASSMPKLRAQYGPVIHAAPGSHHWRFENIEFLANSNRGVAIVALGAMDGSQKTLDRVPHHFVFDRVYMHDDEGGSKRGIELNSGSTDIINSYIAGIRRVGQDAQAICGWNGTGPFLIQNNYLEGAGENVMFGGADPDIPGLIPSDITFRDNYVTKPLSWRSGSWGVKNAFELKNAQRVTIDHNVFENSWTQAQTGYLVLFTGLNDGGQCTWCTVKDVTFTNNVVRHGNGGMQLSGHLSYTIPQNIGPASTNIVIRNNLFYDINEAWGGGSPLGTWILIGNDINNVTIEHNTVDQVNSGKPSIIVSADRPMNGVVIRNNFFNRGRYGLFAGGNYGEGSSTWNGMFQNSVFQKNVIIDEIGAPPAYPSTTEFISINTFRAQLRNPANGDYSLLPSSRFKGAATDGGDIGVNMNTLVSGGGGGSGATSTVPRAPTHLRVRE